jgi:hypothetical protein
MPRQYRQGDVLLCAIDAIPSSAKPVPSEDDRVVVALGELTGHAHAFAACNAQMLRDKGSQRYFLVIGEKGARRCHEEHDPILVPAGNYELRRQREYAPRMPRLVGD